MFSFFIFVIWANLRLDDIPTKKKIIANVLAIVFGVFAYMTIKASLATAYRPSMFYLSSDFDGLLMRFWM